MFSDHFIANLLLSVWQWKSIENSHYLRQVWLKTRWLAYFFDHSLYELMGLYHDGHNHDGHGVYNDGHNNENVKIYGLLLRNRQIHDIVG